ncbi:MAG: tetratricopeptide repeat protein, partial [Gemmatimonadota bacterium]|nr:tetratricopeptide repeat protein [Gemmatimonadota bacterium]
LEQAIEADSTLADAYQLLGNVYERKGDWNRSLENYLRFLELEPEQMGRMQGRVLSVALRSAYPALGAGAVSRDSLSVRNDSSAWREMLQKLETRVSAGDSLKPFLLRVISVGYEALGEHETAIRIYGELLAGNPEDKISRRGLLRMLDAAGRYKEMIPVYEPLLDPEDRNYPRDLFQIGHLCFRTGHREKALEYLEKCVAVDSSLAEGYLLLGNFHQLESNWRQALQNYLTYLGFNPGAVRELWDRLLIVSIRAGQLEGPVALLEGLAAGGDTSAWNTEALGTLYYHTGKYEDALRLIEPLEECGGLSENGYYTLGFVYSRLDRTGDAVEAFGEVKRRRPDFMEVYLVLGRLYYTMKSLDRAEEIFSAGLERVGEDDRDNHRELLFSLANIYHEQGDDSKTEAYLKLVLEQDPDYAQALNYLGYFYAERGTNLEQARQMITRALEKDPGNGHYIDSLGWVLFKMGEHKKALGYIRKSLEIVGDQEEVYEHLGDIHHAMGKPELAREAWNKGLEMNGRNLKLQKKLEQLEAELNSETSDK